MISEAKKNKFIKLKNIQSVEKQMRKVKKEIRRLQPKVQKAADNYNRMVKINEKGEALLKILEKKRNELLLEFKEIEG